MKKLLLSLILTQGLIAAPIHDAARHGDAEAVQMLLTNGADVYNIADTNDAPGTNSKNCIVLFIDEANKDFHLSSSDTCARDSGIDLSSDPYLSFSDDIDGELRISPWDIGADEVSAIIYECNDTIDNDNDGLVDMADLGCDNETDNDETNSITTNFSNI